MTPVEPAFVVNAATTLGQTPNGVASAPDGHFVVVWNQTFGVPCGFNCPPVEGGPFLRRFDENGVPLTGDVLIRDALAGFGGPALVNDADGGFVLLGGAPPKMSGRRFGQDGAPLGSEFDITSAPFRAHISDERALARDAAGNFVVAWRVAYQLTDNVDVRARRFTRDGEPRGQAFRVNSLPIVDSAWVSIVREVDVASSARGDFVVVWRRPEGDYPRGIFARRFDEDGTPQGGEFAVSAPATQISTAPRVATDASGNFLIVWANASESGTSIVARRFHPDGVPYGDEFLVSESPADTLTHQIAVLADPAGVFTIVWDSRTSVCCNSHILARRYLPDGSAEGPELRVNGPIEVASFAFGPLVAVQGPGRLVVVWKAGGVRARRFDVSRDIPVPLRTLVVKPGKHLRFKGRGTFSLPEVGDDPVTHGAVLRVTDASGSAEHALAPSGWRRIGRGTRHVRGYGFRGSPCRKVVLTRKRISAVCRRDTGSLAVTSTGPLNVELRFGSGSTRYCARCERDAAGTSQAGVTARRCPAPAACS